jgi:hypothetical protein
VAARSEDLYLQDAPVVRFPRPRPRYSHRQIEARRRFLASCVVVLLAVVLFMLATGPEGTVQASRSSAPRAVALQPGQSLWDLAERYAAPGQDLRAYVDSLVEINDIDGLPQIGERVRLPH